MFVLASVNVLLYSYVVFLALKFFRPPADSARDSDQTIVAGIGMISALLVFVLVAVITGYSHMGTAGRGAMALMLFFCIANGTVYIAIIKAISGEKIACQERRKRYFP